MQLALSCATELKSTLYEATAKLTASRVYNFTNQFNLALSYADEALQCAREAGFSELTIEAQTAQALALSNLGKLEEAKQLLQIVLQTAHQQGMVFKINKIGLELDRLNNDIESARKRMEWFAERGLLNGVNIAKRYFPELAENKKEAVAESNVRLEVLGTLQVTGDKSIPIRGRKRQELLAQLIEARLSGRSDISRLSLLDALYPEEDELKASSSLKAVVHVLRESFGESFITTTPTGYALGSCTSDAEEFLQTGNTLLWRGLYLEGLDLLESNVRESLYMTLYDKAKTLLEHNPQEVARVGNILVEAEPYNLEYLRTYLSALRHSKNHGKLTRHYQEARERLLEVNETLPESWQTFLG
jgi:tetratricopeptide (TPR) repeat protein